MAYSISWVQATALHDRTRDRTRDTSLTTIQKHVRLLQHSPQYRSTFARSALPHPQIDRRMITRNYMSGWFLIDFPSSLPLELLELFEASVIAREGGGGDDDATAGFASLKMLRALRLLRLLRLLKVLKMQSYIHMIEDATDINLQVLTLIKLLIGVLYLTHILGCLWFSLHVSVYRPTSRALASRGQSGASVEYIGEAAGDAEPVTWLSVYDGGSGVAADVWVQYLYSVYWALTTLTTVGYGDITPSNNVERLYAFCCELVGAIVFGFMLSTLGDVLSNVDRNATHIDEKLTEVKEYLRWHRVPPTTAKAVRRYYEYFLSRRTTVDDEAILGNLTPSLRREVTVHLLEQTVARIPLLTRRNTTKGTPNSYVDLAFQLKVYPMLKPMLREAKESIFAKHALGDDLYLLSRGHVTASGDLGLTYFTMNKPGSVFGEHALFGRASEFACVAQVRCELFCIAIDDLAQLANTLSSAGRHQLAENLLDEYFKHSVTRNVALRLFSSGLHCALTREETTAIRIQRGFYVLQVRPPP